MKEERVDLIYCGLGNKHRKLCYCVKKKKMKKSISLVDCDAM